MEHAPHSSISVLLCQPVPMHFASTSARPAFTDGGPMCAAQHKHMLAARWPHIYLSVTMCSFSCWRARYESWKQLSQRAKSGGACWRDHPWGLMPGMLPQTLSQVTANNADASLVHMPCRDAAIDPLLHFLHAAHVLNHTSNASLGQPW